MAGVTINELDGLSSPEQGDTFPVYSNSLNTTCQVSVNHSSETNVWGSGSRTKYGHVRSLNGPTSLLSDSSDSLYTDTDYGDAMSVAYGQVILEDMVGNENLNNTTHITPQGNRPIAWKDYNTGDILILVDPRGLRETHRGQLFAATKPITQGTALTIQSASNPDGNIIPSSIGRQLTMLNQNSTKYGVRNKDITSYLTDNPGELRDRIRGLNGFEPFDDIYPGDYIQWPAGIPFTTIGYEPTEADQNPRPTAAGTNRFIVVHRMKGDLTGSNINKLLLMPTKSDTTGSQYGVGVRKMYLTNNTTGILRVATLSDRDAINVQTLSIGQCCRVDNVSNAVRYYKLNSSRVWEDTTQESAYETATGAYLGSRVYAELQSMAQNSLYDQLNSVLGLRNSGISLRPFNWGNTDIYLSSGVNFDGPNKTGGSQLGATFKQTDLLTQTYFILPSELNIFGTTFFSSSGFDCSPLPFQFELFKLDPTWAHSTSEPYWLYDMASYNSVCMCRQDSFTPVPHFIGASGLGHLRPVFMI